MTQLRAPTQNDLINGARWGQDPEVLAMDPPAGSCVDPLMWAIYTDNGIHIGFITIYNRTSTDTELGVRIGEKSYWGQGHGTWAVKETLKYVFGPAYWLTMVHLKVIPINTRAIRCYEKCGFVALKDIVVDNILFVYMEVNRELLS